MVGVGVEGSEGRLGIESFLLRVDDGVVVEVVSSVEAMFIGSDPSPVES